MERFLTLRKVERKIRNANQIICIPASGAHSQNRLNLTVSVVDPPVKGKRIRDMVSQLLALTITLAI